MIARNSLFSITGSIVPVLVTIVTLPFLLGLIGAERYGALALCWLILIYSAQVLDGVGTAITHAVARARGDQQSARDSMATGLVTALLISPITAIFASVIAFVFFGQFFEVSDTVRNELVASIWLIGASSFVSGVSRAVYGALVGKERFPSASLATMVSNSGLPVLALLFANVFGVSLVVLMWASLSAYCLGLALLSFNLWRSELRGQPAYVTWDKSKALLQFGVWIMVASSVAPLLLTMDRMVIGVQLGAVAVAAYTIPFQIISRLQLLPQSLVRVLFPRLSMSDGTKAYELGFHYSIAMSACFAPMVIGMIYLIEPLLRLWLGDKLDPSSVQVGTWLLCAFYLSAIVQTKAVYLQSQGKGARFAKFQIGLILPYLVILFHSAQAFGIMGVVVAFLLRRMAEALFLVAKSNFGNRTYWTTQAPAIAGLLMAMATVEFLPNPEFKLAAGVVVASAVFIGAIFIAPAELKTMILEEVRKRFSL
ncbi:oligosaccharide flippase family protein [uncultured Erythrobacter sp.]|uniref:oligosaccharide flippase family protein n=1 Tax=uncultured Erythrobacter sp. TaxID=263913 RepID=UPI002639FEE5|nr:oligosaccharide flippase family protein [uncultured Erythrobacter sp.]